MSDFHDNVKIWEAARATSAATSFFDPVTINEDELCQTFVDGATGANNPVRRLWQEAQRLWGGPLEPRIQCLVSIGTGVPSIKKFGENPIQVIQTLKAIATETEITAAEFQVEHEDDLVSSGRYIRLNVANGLEDVGLDEAAKKSHILAATRRYGELPEIRNALKTFRLAVADFVTEHVEDDLVESNFMKVSQRTMSFRPYSLSQNPVDQQETERRDQESLDFNFLERSAIFLKLPARHYWDYVTLCSLREYAELYKVICNRVDGLVSCKMDVEPFTRV
jgi:predicted acylesterase/phospholipase RssA